MDKSAWIYLTTQASSRIKQISVAISDTEYAEKYVKINCAYSIVWKQMVLHPLPTLCLCTGLKLNGSECQTILAILLGESGTVPHMVSAGSTSLAFGVLPNVWEWGCTPAVCSLQGLSPRGLGCTPFGQCWCIFNAGACWQEFDIGRFWSADLQMVP